MSERPTGPVSPRDPRPGGAPLRVLVLTPYYLPGYRGGGPIRTIAAMVAAHGRRHAFAVVTSDRDWGEPEPLPVPTGRWVDVGAARVRYVAHSPGAFGTLRAAAGVVRHVHRARPDVLYLNGLFPVAWSLVPAVLARARTLPRTQVLLAPRGELGAGALALKAAKKSLFLRVARAVGLYRAVTWHASTPQEATEVAAVFPGARVLVRENETTLPARAVPPPEPAGPLGGAASADDPAAATPPLRLLFVSRVSAKKGLDVLLRALRDVPAAVELDVYGDGEALAACRGLADELPQQHVVRWHGAVPAESLDSAYRGHEALGLPTAHENFGHVIPEALARACPVLVPDTTPWTAVIAGGGGRVVASREPSDWAAALTALATAPADERHAARVAAAAAYDRWAATRPTGSVFDLL